MAAYFLRKEQMQMKLVLAEKPSIAQSMSCISFDTLKEHKKRKRLHNLNILKESIEVARMGKKEKMRNLLIILSA